MVRSVNSNGKGDQGSDITLLPQHDHAQQQQHMYPVKSAMPANCTVEQRNVPSEQSAGYGIEQQNMPSRQAPNYTTEQHMPSRQAPNHTTSQRHAPPVQTTRYTARPHIPLWSTTRYTPEQYLSLRQTARYNAMASAQSTNSTNRQYRPGPSRPSEEDCTPEHHMPSSQIPSRTLDHLNFSLSPRPAPLVHHPFPIAINRNGTPPLIRIDREANQMQTMGPQLTVAEYFRARNEARKM